ncbi:hypothetical protein Hanom_Chr15g01389371 [Helianthus anomalus]
MSPRVRTRHGEVTAELAWSGSGSWSEITPAVGRTVHLPPPHNGTSIHIHLIRLTYFMFVQCFCLLSLSSYTFMCYYYAFLDMWEILLFFLVYFFYLFFIDEVYTYVWF